MTESEEYLTEKIPERARYLQEKQAWQTDTAQLFPYIAKADGEDYEQFIQIRQAPAYKSILDSLPNGDFIAGVITKGMKALEAEQTKKPNLKAKTPPPQIWRCSCSTSRNKGSQTKESERKDSRIRQCIGLTIRTIFNLTFILSWL